MKPRKVPEKLKEEFGDIRPIRGFPDYWITSEKKIISTKGVEPRTLATWGSNNSRAVVELYKNSEAHRRSVDQLYYDAYGDFKGYPSAIYQDMMEEYEGNEEVEAWVEENIGPLVNRHKPK